MIDSFEELSKDIIFNQNSVQYFVLLVFNNSQKREKAILILKRELTGSFSFHSINVEREKKDYIPFGLYHRLSDIKKESKKKKPCVFIYGLEYNFSENMKKFNSHRELFKFDLPIIFFLPIEFEKKMMDIAPDLFGLFGNNRHVVDNLDTELSNDEIVRILKEFEEKYQMNSGDFYKKWVNGNIEDSFEMQDWMMIYQLSEIMQEHED